MFERFRTYHGLDNLLWVWAGQDPAFYPGDGFADIIGEDIYNMDDVSNAPVFVRSGGYSERSRLTALTECGLLPNVDILGRDGAFWLWAALYRGDFLIDHRGRHNSLYNTRERLERIYNHELTITLDKLPERF
jgi:mannan endo-1,4-beta-mannosidase